MKSQHAKMGKVSSIPPQGHPSNAGRQSIEKKRKKQVILCYWKRTQHKMFLESDEESRALRSWIWILAFAYDSLQVSVLLRGFPGFQERVPSFVFSSFKM